MPPAAAAIGTRLLTSTLGKEIGSSAKNVGKGIVEDTVKGGAEKLLTGGGSPQNPAAGNDHGEIA